MKNKMIYVFLLSGMISKNAFAQSAENKKVIQNNVVVDSVKKAEVVTDIAQKVVEATYKNYPQQPGQPSIIINNIIVPPDYNRQSVAPAVSERPARATPSHNKEYQEDKEYQEYQEWLRDRRDAEKGMRKEFAEQKSNTDFTDLKTDKKRKSFQERFGERPARNSGTWIIPVVGVHASALGSDDNKINESGRTGWNAGLDVRIRMKRFFIQPGVHYLNSSMAVTDKDSVTHTKFFDGPRIHSLKVPFLFGVYLTKANSGFFKLNVKGGVVGNYILAVDKNDMAQFTKDNIKEYAYGLNGGLGLEFGLVSLDLNYEGGITKYFKDSNTKNNMVRVTLGIKI